MRPNPEPIGAGTVRVEYNYRNQVEVVDTITEPTDTPEAIRARVRANIIARWNSPGHDYVFILTPPTTISGQWVSGGTLAQWVAVEAQESYRGGQTPGNQATNKRVFLEEIEKSMIAHPVDH